MHSLRIDLRSETRPFHSATDELVMASLVDDGAWNRFLRSLVCSLQTHSAGLDASSELFGIVRRAEELLGLVRADLAHSEDRAGEAVDRLDVSSIDVRHGDGNQAMTTPQALGVGYVFEGSALGAATVREYLIDNGRTSLYFDELARTSHERWPTVARYLGATTFNTSQQRQAIAAANSVFSGLLSPAVFDVTT